MFLSDESFIKEVFSSPDRSIMICDRQSRSNKVSACRPLFNSLSFVPFLHKFEGTEALKLEDYKLSMGFLHSFLLSLMLFRAATKTIRLHHLTRLQSTMSSANSIPSLPRSILTEFGQTLKDSINKILSPIQEEASAQDELRETVFSEVCHCI